MAAESIYSFYVRLQQEREIIINKILTNLKIKLLFLF